MMRASRETGHHSPFDTPTAAMIVVDARGRVTGWSPGASSLYGADTRDVLDRPVSEVLRDVRARADTLQGFEAPGAPASGGARTETRTVRRPDGSLAETVLRIFPVEQGQGRPAWVVMAVASDRYEERMTDQSMLSRLFTQAPVGLSVYGPDTRLKWVNEAVQEAMGWHAGEWFGRPHIVLYPHGKILSPPGYHDMDEVLNEVLSSGEPVLDVHWRGPTPAASEYYQVYSCSYFRLQDEAGHPLGICEAAVDVTDRYEAQTRLALLGRASGIGTTLDARQTAEELAGLVVPEFADSVRIEVAESVLGGEEVPSYASGAPAGLRLMTQRTKSNFDITNSDVLLGAIGIRSTTAHQRLLALPLLLGSTTLGTVTLLRQPPRAPFTEEDRALAEELTSRTAVCLDNARRYIREHTTALKLQRDLLPRALPQSSGIEVADRYIPAAGPLGVGGDWYDVIPLSGARVGLVVGDVVGHGVDAAATMGRLRTSVRALAALDLPPDELLARLDDLVGQTRVGVHRTPGDEGTDRALGATCLYAVYDPTSCTCAMASAGHLPPVAAGRGAGARQAEVLDLPIGPPLGIGGLPFESAEFEFAEGTVLALFTDGIVKARNRDVDEGVADLCDALDASTASLQQRQVPTRARGFREIVRLQATVLSPPPVASLAPDAELPARLDAAHPGRQKAPVLGLELQSAPGQPPSGPCAAAPECFPGRSVAAIWVRSAGLGGFLGVGSAETEPAEDGLDEQDGGYACDADDHDGGADPVARAVGRRTEHGTAVGEDQQVDQHGGADQALQDLGADQELDDVHRGHRHRGAEHDLGGEQAQEQWGVAEAAGDGAFHSGSLADRVTGRQRYDCAGQGAGADQTHGEEDFGVLAGDRFEGFGGLGGGVQRTGVANGGDGGDDDRQADDAGEHRPDHGVQLDQPLVLGLRAAVYDTCGGVELHVRADGRADQGDREQDEALVGFHVRDHQVLADLASVRVAEDHRDRVGEERRRHDEEDAFGPSVGAEQY